MITREQTVAWWDRCLADPAKFAAWVQKLWWTEVGGYQEHVAFIQAHPLSLRERSILQHVADDELKHASLLGFYMEEKGIGRGDTPIKSAYWDNILADAKSFSAYCAANYYGEALAAERFKVLVEHPGTPEDFRGILQMILPDEVFHRVTLEKLATKEDLAKYAELHRQSLELIRPAS